jgi:hypothetical protein
MLAIIVWFTLSKVCLLGLISVMLNFPNFKGMFQL